MVHSLHIGNSTYFIQGSDTDTLKFFADKLNLKYDKLEPSKLSSSQKIIRIWAIGELSDHLKK
jgi:hypothetical protein